MSVKVNIKDEQKKIKLPTGTRLLMRKTCIATLKMEEFEDPAEVDITLVNDSIIHEMNRKFRKIDAPTDVLSFPLGEKGQYDTNPETGAKMLYISTDYVFDGKGERPWDPDDTCYAPLNVYGRSKLEGEQADLYGHGIEREIAFLTAHSMLHLLGYDHEKGGLEKTIMREKEEQVLDALGLAVTKV